MSEGVAKGTGAGWREWREDLEYINDAGATCMKLAKATGNLAVLGTVTSAGAVDSNGNITIANTAPFLKLADSTGAAKQLTIKNDANLAQLRESAGADGSLLVLDLANARVGIATAAPSVALDVTGAIKASTTMTIGTGLTVTAGGALVSAGNIVATLGNISAPAAGASVRFDGVTVTMSGNTVVFTKGALTNVLTLS